MSRLLLYLLALLLLAARAAFAQAGAEDKPKPDKLPTPAEEFRALVRDYNEVEDAMWQAAAKINISKEDPKEVTKKFEATYGKKLLALPGRFLELARKYPNDPVAFDALVFLVTTVGCPESSQAVEILIRDHIRNEKLGPVCLRLAICFGNPLSALGEKLLRAALEKSPHRDVQGLACFSLARHLRSKSALVEKLNQADAVEQVKQLEAQHGKEFVNKFKDSDPNQLSREVDQLFERVLEKYADVKSPKSGTLGEVVRALRSAISGALAIGKPAPEIEGEDFDGKKFKLSDYRGKVVVLDFWGHWCGYCRAIYPHGRSFVKKYEGKPFALLGVNSDEDKAELRKVMDKEQITWRFWFDGGTQGPIATKWNIESFPKIYVLDAKGVIRHKDMHAKDLEGAVDALLKELETGATKSPK